MFGPNARGTVDGRNFHHRGPEYAQLLDDLQSEFKKRFGARYEYLFLSGSGTMANEAVMFSSLKNFQVLNDTEEFSGRLRKLAEANGIHNQHSLNHAFAHYETAIAMKMDLLKYANREAFHFVDCVSSLPYYHPPSEAKVWTTVSSKQLGGLPIVSVVAVHKRYWHGFMPEDAAYSVLNLARYRSSQKKGMSPHTPSIPLLADLLGRVQDLKLDEFRSWIDERRSTVLNYFPDDAVGEGPSVVIDARAIRKKIAKKNDLYVNAHGDYQLFLYSDPLADMKEICQELTE